MSRFWEKWKNWELWPFWMRYALITPKWLMYCIKARSLWFFTPSNPTISFGGFEGETKSEMYQQLPPNTFPKTVYIEPQFPFENVLQIIKDHEFTYPFIVKPDVGMSGVLFRKIETEAQLKRYHQHLPATYLIQDLVAYPIEFSVFYYRFPGEDKGCITGFLQKEPMHVFGNGEDSLLTLIEQHPKAKHRQDELKAWHNERLSYIIPNGEKFYLTMAANLNRGASFINLHHEIDDRLCAVFDELNFYSKTFFYGRYDLKASSLEDLKKGKNFLILEYNGSGAEPNHVYNSGYSLKAAQQEILKHWKVLYRISIINHKKGIPYWSFRDGWEHMKKAKQHFKKLHEIDTIV
jgi:hypothetical protein